MISFVTLLVCSMTVADAVVEGEEEKEERKVVAVDDDDDDADAEKLWLESIVPSSSTSPSPTTVSSLPPSSMTPSSKAASLPPSFVPTSLTSASVGPTHSMSPTTAGGGGSSSSSSVAPSSTSPTTAQPTTTAPTTTAPTTTAPTTASPATTMGPTITPYPSLAPSFVPSLSFAPTTIPEPRSSSAIGRIIKKTIGWIIILGLSTLLFGFLMSNRYRIYFFVRGLWYSFLSFTCVRWILEKVGYGRGVGGGRDDGYDPVMMGGPHHPHTSHSLNEIIFDQNDLAEGLLMGDNNRAS